MVVVAFIGGIGGWEIALILVLALVIFGPQRLPELARSLGKLSAQIRAANRQLQREFYENLDPDEIRRKDPARPPVRQIEPAGGEPSETPEDSSSGAAEDSSSGAAEDNSSGATDETGEDTGPRSAS